MSAFSKSGSGWTAKILDLLVVGAVFLAVGCADGPPGESQSSDATTLAGAGSEPPSAPLASRMIPMTLLAMTRNVSGTAASPPMRFLISLIPNTSTSKVMCTSILTACPLMLM